MRTFDLYPEERHWWSFEDYGVVLDQTKALGAKTVLEFGPGSSTLALIEGGATLIDACEDNEVWWRINAERIVARFPDIVQLCPYRIREDGEVRVRQSRLERYDLALVDGPRETTARPPVIEHALTRADAVLVCCEDTHGSHLTNYVLQAAAIHQRMIELIPSGAASGHIALIR